MYSKAFLAVLGVFKGALRSSSCFSYVLVYFRAFLVVLLHLREIVLTLNRVAENLNRSLPSQEYSIPSEKNPKTQDGTQEFPRPPPASLADRSL